MERFIGAATTVFIVIGCSMKSEDPLSKVCKFFFILMGIWGFVEIVMMR